MLVFYSSVPSHLSLVSLSRYILLARAMDATSDVYLSMFNNEAEKIIGCSADELDKLRSEVYNCTCIHILKVASDFKFLKFFTFSRRTTSTS